MTRERETDRHTTMAYTVLAWRHAAKTNCITSN